MVKKDLIEYLSHNFGFTKSVSNEVISNIFNEIKDAITRGDIVKIKDFGVFKSKMSNPRVCRDPRTGSRVDVSSKKKISFKVSNSLKRFINS
mgnify:CR=1 FL=1